MRVKLGDVAVESREIYRGSQSGVPIVGLEHLTPQDVNLTEWNVDTDNTFSKMFRKGQVLFGRRRAYLKKAAVAPCNGICSGDITVIAIKPEALAPELLPFIIQNDRFFDFAMEKSAGSLSPRAKWEHLRDFEFDLPPMDEQRRLAEVLWAFDETKQAYKRLFKLTDELVKSQFVEMLNQSGISADAYVELVTICRRPPQNGLYKKDLGEQPNAKIVKMKQLFTDNPISQEVGLDEVYMTEKELSSFRLTPDDLLFGRRSLVVEGAGKCSLVGSVADDVVFESSVLRITLDTNRSIPLWLYHWFKSDGGKAAIEAIRNVVTIAGIKGSDLKALRVPVIDIDLQRRFAAFAEAADKSKVICRYQQFEGANLIVERVKAGYPKKDLIWHFQGSGKSLLMVFAAQKLRMTPELKNPTVAIIDDRIDLETQITATFNASDIPNLQSASSKDELIAFFRGDMRKILITTIFKFGEVDGELNARDNIILMVDEAHRTQEGDLGEKMRMALPNAFFFGLTGTPINRTDKNTFFTFGATEDKSGYMSRYSFSDSIRDNATLPLHFEAVPVDLHVNQDVVDAAFDEMTETLTKDEKNELAKRVKMEAIMKSPERIRKVCEHIAKHFREKIEPNGFKGQVVCYDRECCLLYKKQLDDLLGEDATTIVMDTNNDKEGRYKEYRRDRDAEGKLLDFFREPASELKLVIVTAKLLTGFDAPVLQAMYLDKPMKDHTLLQAICRTNRVYGQEKSHGLIVDYIGIFDDVAKALDFDEKNVQQVITNIAEVKKQFPALMAKCLSYFNGVDRTIEGWEGLMAAQECLPTSKEKDEFGADYKVLCRAYEALSPDSFLFPYRADYLWLTKVYESVRPTDGRGGLIWAALGAKTIELVHQNVTVENVREDIDILELDADLIDDFFEHNKEGKKKIKEIDIDLVAKIRRHGKDDKFIKLGERLEDLREKHEQGLVSSIEFLKLLLELAKEAAEAEKEYVPEEEIDKGKAALTELFNNVKNPNTPIIVERIVADIDAIVKIVRFDGWQSTTAGKQEVTKALRSVIWIKYKLKDKDIFDKAYSYIEMYY